MQALFVDRRRTSSTWHARVLIASGLPAESRLFHSTIRSLVMLAVPLWFLASMAPTRAADEADFVIGEMAIHDGDHVSAYRAWLPLARMGHVDSQYAIGALLSEGRGVERDYREAYAWWNRAAVQSHSGAQYNIGMMLKAGLGVEADPAKAHDWLERAARQGNSDAQVALGRFHRTGCGVARNRQEAFFWLEIARRGGRTAISGELRSLGLEIASDERLAAIRRADEWLIRRGADSDTNRLPPAPNADE